MILFVGIGYSIRDLHYSDTVNDVSASCCISSP